MESSRRHTRTPIAPRDGRVAGCYEQGSSPEDGPPDVLGRWRGSALAGLDVVGRVQRPGRVSLRALRELAFADAGRAPVAGARRQALPSELPTGCAVPLLDLFALVGLRVEAEVVGFRTADGEVPVARVDDLLKGLGGDVLVLGSHRGADVDPTGPIEFCSRLMPASAIGSGAGLGVPTVSIEVWSFDEFCGWNP